MMILSKYIHKRASDVVHIIMNILLLDNRSSRLPTYQPADPHNESLIIFKFLINMCTGM